MAFYFEAQHKEVKARIKGETRSQAEEIRGALSRQGVHVGDMQECDRSFYRSLPEVKKARQIMEVLGR